MMEPGPGAQQLGQESLILTRACFFGWRELLLEFLILTRVLFLQGGGSSWSSGSSPAGGRNVRSSVAACDKRRCLEHLPLFVWVYFMNSSENMRFADGHTVADNAGSLTSEVKRHRDRLVLAWRTAWEDLRVLSAFYTCRLHESLERTCQTLSFTIAISGSRYKLGCCGDASLFYSACTPLPHLLAKCNVFFMQRFFVNSSLIFISCSLTTVYCLGSYRWYSKK